MNKKKNRLFMLLWILVAVTSRIQYFLFGGNQAVDTYGYFSNAMMRVERQELVFNPGLSYAFTKNLSAVLKFTGNLIGMVSVYQLIVQILWMILFVAGAGMLFGKLAGFVSSGILMVSPWILGSVFSISPENYFMSYFSILLMALGFFCDRAKKKGWRRSLWGKLYLDAAGFFVGMICIWNYLGWFLLPMLIYVPIRNRAAQKDRINRQKQEAELKESQRFMGTGAQIFHLTAGAVIGSYATLMKYTGITGTTIVEQFKWWAHQLLDFPGRCQDIDIELSVWLGGSVLVGVIGQLLYRLVRKGKAEDFMEEEPEEVSLEKPVQKEADPGEPGQKEASPEEPAQKETSPEEPAQKEASPEEPAQKEASPEEPAQEKASPEEPIQKEEAVSKQAGGETETAFQREETAMESSEGGRKVEFLDNPLPVPKRHVKRDIGFDFNEVKMEFDIEISENDDFDL